VCLNKKLNLILFANGMNVCCFNFLFVEFVLEKFSKLFLKIKIKVGLPRDLPTKNLDGNKTYASKVFLRHAK
jgi:hypothetical protein